MAEVILQKVAHEQNNLYDLNCSEEPVVDLSIDIHSTINRKSDIKNYLVVPDFIPLIRKYRKSAVDFCENLIIALLGCDATD